MARACEVRAPRQGWAGWSPDVVDRERPWQGRYRLTADASPQARVLFGDAPTLYLAIRQDGDRIVGQAVERVEELDGLEKEYYDRAPPDRLRVASIVAESQPAAKVPGIPVVRADQPTARGTVAVEEWEFARRYGRVTHEVRMAWMPMEVVLVLDPVTAGIQLILDGKANVRGERILQPWATAAQERYRQQVQAYQEWLAEGQKLADYDRLRADHAEYQRQCQLRLGERDAAHAEYQRQCQLRLQERDAEHAEYQRACERRLGVAGDASGPPVQRPTGERPQPRYIAWGTVATAAVSVAAWVAENWDSISSFFSALFGGDDCEDKPLPQGNPPRYWGETEVDKWDGVQVREVIEGKPTIPVWGPILPQNFSVERSRYANGALDVQVEGFVLNDWAPFLWRERVPGGHVLVWSQYPYGGSWACRTPDDPGARHWHIRTAYRVTDVRPGEEVVIVAPGQSAPKWTYKAEAAGGGVQADGRGQGKGSGGGWGWLMGAGAAVAAGGWLVRRLLRRR